MMNKAPLLATVTLYCGGHKGYTHIHIHEHITHVYTHTHNIKEQRRVTCGSADFRVGSALSILLATTAPRGFSDR